MVHWFDQLPSTQDEAHRLASGGAPHGTAVGARIQTAGRGTRGRTWVSSPGGLWLSVIARPVPGDGIPVMSLRVGIALADFVDTVLARDRGSSNHPAVLPPVRLKWPNDLLLDGRKLGGVLCEARWQGDRLSWIVVGIGLNVHNPLPPPAAAQAVRLAEHGFAGETEALGDPLARIVARATGSAGPFSEAELAAFTARDWLRGRTILRPVAGTAIGISLNGRLRVALAGGGVAELEDSSGLEVGR